MRVSLLSLVVAGLTAVATPAANAQALLASNTPSAFGHRADPAEPTTTLGGRILTADGPLPGAVVTIVSTRQMAVTNSEGEFQFEVPVTTRSLVALVTCAGYADEKLVLNSEDAESTATLAGEPGIAATRRQQLRVYLRSARKEVHRELRTLHRNCR